MAQRFILTIALPVLLGGPFLAPPANAQWQALGLSGREVNRLSVHGEFLYACTSDGLHRLSRADADTFWTPRGFAGQRVLDLVALGPQTLLAAKALTQAPQDTVSLFRSMDGGATWQAFQNGFGAGTTSGRQARRILALAASPGGVLASSSRIEKSDDGGLTWRIVAQASVLNALEASPANPMRVWAGGETAIFSPYILTSTNAGETWKQTDLFAGGDNAVDAIAGHPTNESIVYLGMEGRVMKTEDGGTSWTTVTSPNPSMYTFGLVIRPLLPLEVCAAGSSFTPHPRGVVFHQSLDGGVSWQAISHPAAAGYGATHLLMRTGPERETLYVATGNGVYRHTQGTVDVPRREGWNGIALRCSPNPFRDATAIEFTLPSAGRVSLRVLDVRGRTVATLLDAKVGAGRQRVPWESGTVASGLYLARLESGDEIATVKVVHVR